MAARPYISPNCPDPNIRHGRFRVLCRVDQTYIVYDPWLPLGRRTVGDRTFVKTNPKDSPKERAEAFAKSLFANSPGVDPE